MSHIVGTVQIVSPALTVGPDSGAAPSSPNTWALNFAHTAAPGGTKFLMLHFTKVKLPAKNRLEVDLGYDTDVFTSADGTDFWTRPINIYALPGGKVPVRYVTKGATTGGAQLDRYGRGERHPGVNNPAALSNCDPFLKDPTYLEPIYDPFWYCSDPPKWENVACVPVSTDVRARVARSVGILVTVETQAGVISVSTCSVTLVDSDKVITAGHCHTPAEALTGSVTFDYQTDCSGNRPAGYNARFFKVSKVLQHRYDSGGDYSLLQLVTAPPGIPPIQMRHDIPGVGEQVFGVHHPNGAVKKLSVPHPGFASVPSSSATSINVPTNFSVSGGSSGSGLFDTAGRIVGVLSNGNPCGTGGPVSLLTYFPMATFLSQIAPVPPPALTRDVVVVFDRSGSMSMDDGTGRTKIDVAKDALSLFVQLVNSGSGNRCGLVSFSTSASSPADFKLAPVTTTSKKALIGPPPYSGAIVGALAAGGATSIGDGLDKAFKQFPSPGANPRALLVMTDGLENTFPFIKDREGLLGGIDVHAIGFGSESNLNGAILTKLATDHKGLYTRAGNGLALEKFFSHAFGNIFEAGILMDPDFDLPANQRVGDPQAFHVCGEETVTIVVGWDRSDATLLVEVTTPGGATVTAGSPGVEGASGRTWTFLRVRLPHGGERDGLWNARVFRPGQGEFPPPAPALHYFINIIPSGGPRLHRLPDDHQYYTGDLINPLVLLRYPDGTWPDGAKMQVTVSAPDTGAGNILSGAGLRPAVNIDQDTLPARQATLTALERESGRPLFAYTQRTLDLFDDPSNPDGRMEPAAIFGSPLTDLLTMEGNYTFHFKAIYGEGCTATRELLWSVHVDVGIDPGRTGVTTTVGPLRPDGRHDLTIVITPRDKYGSNLGPGRPDGFSVTGSPGTETSGPPQDDGDGSYSVFGTWDPTTGLPPGVVIAQPGRPPVVVQEPPHGTGGEPDEPEDEDERMSFTGKVDGLAYDRHGDFEGFILDTEEGDRTFRSHERDVEELVYQAWLERIVTTVWVERDDRHRPLTIILRGAPPRLEP